MKFYVHKMTIEPASGCFGHIRVEARAYDDPMLEIVTYEVPRNELKDGQLIAIETLEEAAARIRRCGYEASIKPGFDPEAPCGECGKPR